MGSFSAHVNMIYTQICHYKTIISSGNHHLEMFIFLSVFLKLYIGKNELGMKIHTFTVTNKHGLSYSTGNSLGPLVS